MGRTTLLELGFTVGIVLAAGTIAVVAFGRASHRMVVAVTCLLAALATAAWIVFAQRPSDELALSAAGLTVCVFLAAAGLPLRRALARGRRIDEELAAAERRLHQLVSAETSARSAELERALARARADTISLLTDEERRIAEERRRALAERERQAGAELAETLAGVQRRVESRLAGWTGDLDRAQQNLTAELAKLGERQRQLISEAEARILADVERLEAGSEDQRAFLARLREELGRTAKQLVTESEGELETHAADRRRALHELGERLRRRERELAERIEREENEAAERIRTGLADVERRALEAFERAVDRASARYAEQAGQQFTDTIKVAREDAARRLARELDRAVETFTREASTVLAERLAHVGDAGAQRLEKRMSQIAAGLERHREELAAALEQRLGEAESELRRRAQVLIAEVDSERTVLQARLNELARRIDEAVAASREGFGALSSRER
jgi:gas vesicle protein